MTDTSQRPSKNLAPGEARPKGPSIQELLDQEPQDIPWQLRHAEYTFLGDAMLDIDHYTSQEFADLEKERLWPRIWQLAAFAHDLPNVGDHIVYDILDWSFIIKRTGPGTDDFKAFYNSCLHRGRALCENDTVAANSPFLRCAFHGLCWENDGALKEIPPSIEFDFPHVDHSEFGLPEARCEVWDSLIFINMDDDAEPLGDFLGDITKHFERWPFSKRVKASHKAKIINCNWKVAQEAFMDAFHVLATHPQLNAGLLGGDGSNTEYNIYGGGDANWSRMTMAPPIPNPNLPYEITERELIEEIFFRGEVVTDRGTQTFNGSADDLPDDATARGIMAGQLREMGAKPAHSGPAPGDTELTSAIQYHIFPNISPWPGSIFYRNRPYGNDPDWCIMEILAFAPAPPDGEIPPSAPIVWLGEDEHFGSIFNQDMENVPLVQKGLKAAKRPGGLTLANYQDIKVRWHHRLLEKWVADVGD